MPTFYTCDEDAERLYHTSIGEAVYDHMDMIYPDQPETLVVYGFDPEEKPAPEKISNGHLLEDLLERLDEDYGSPEDYAHPTDAMRAAELDFVRAVLDEYRVWRCKLVTTETVRVLDYVDADWLADG
jgi:hypothetical protein